jgi:hypothetical protein
MQVMVTAGGMDEQAMWKAHQTLAQKVPPPPPHVHGQIQNELLVPSAQNTKCLHEPLTIKLL